MAAPVIGKGWRFPICPDASGSLTYVDGDDNIALSLEVLLLTDWGQRVMRPTFGSTAARLVFAPGSEHFLRQLESTVSDAIRDWEPRIDVESLSAELRATDETIADVAISYRIRASNTRQNLVFPFYLRDMGQP